MDRELEDQIDTLITKATKDLKTRILRVVTRYNNKVLKQQARELKSSTNKRDHKHTNKDTSRSSKNNHSDGYYSD